MAGEIQLNSVTLATESGGVASIDSSVDIKGPLNASGSAPIYACRAWVNFNGTGTVAIRASGNVSSITDNGGSGDYTVNFLTAMPDANYSWSYSVENYRQLRNVDIPAGYYSSYQLATSLRINTAGVDGNSTRAVDDIIYVGIQIFR